MTTSGSGTSRPTPGSESSEPGSAVTPDQPDHDRSGPVDSGSDPAVPRPPAAGGGAPSASGRRHRQTGPTTPNRAVLVVPGLLVVALVLLVVGLVTGASVWLAVSLGASVLAALLLVVERVVHRRRSARAQGLAAAETDAADDSPDSADGPDSSGSPGSSDTVVDLDPPAIDPDDPDAVWVVDGRPRYHTRECETLRSLPAEPIPRAQALEDGFVACSLCEPGTAAGAAHAR